MQLEMDTIKFESKNEIEQIMVALEEYLNRHSEKDCRAVERLVDLLDTMHMSW